MAIDKVIYNSSTNYHGSEIKFLLLLLLLSMTFYPWTIDSFAQCCLLSILGRKVVYLVYAYQLYIMFQFINLEYWLIGMISLSGMQGMIRVFHTLLAT